MEESNPYQIGKVVDKSHARIKGGGHVDPFPKGTLMSDHCCSSNVQIPKTGQPAGSGSGQSDKSSE